MHNAQHCFISCHTRCKPLSFGYYFKSRLFTKVYERKRPERVKERKRKKPMTYPSVQLNLPREYETMQSVRLPNQT